MKTPARICAIALLVFAMRPAAFAAETPTPAAGHRVVDESHVLSAAEVHQLADKLKNIEDTTGAQIAVLTVPSAGDEGIAPFANRVFVAWGLGHKGVDNGVLIVLASKDRRVRIEVGRGLEGDIPDVIAKRITADTMGPHFKAGRFAEGFNAGVDALASHIGAKPGAPTPASTTESVSDAPPPPPSGIGVPSSQLGRRVGPFLLSTLVFGFAALFGLVFLIAFIVIARKRGWTSGSGYAGGSGFGSSGSSSSSFSSDSNDSSGGGGDSAGGGSDSSY
jgi:uncharacterized protein